jgi:hypothetical protein
VAGVSDQVAASAAVSRATSPAAESCSASATIRTALVDSRTAEWPLCRLVQRRACARPSQRSISGWIRGSDPSFRNCRSSVDRHVAGDPAGDQCAGGQFREVPPDLARVLEVHEGQR